MLTRNKAKVECAAAKWLVGWSCGKETLKNGRYDTLKGSYYVNCTQAFADPQQQAKLAEAYPSFPEYTDANVWPAEDVLPGFERAFRALCNLITDTAALVARACDRYAEVHVGVDDPAGRYRKGYLEHVVRTSLTTKARLLHYFPRQETATNTRINTTNDDYSSEIQQKKNGNETENGISTVTDDQDDWCATHIDHGCLTGLTSAMFIDEAEAEVDAALSTPAPAPASNPDTNSTSTSTSASTSSPLPPSSFTSKTLPTFPTLPPLPELPTPPDPKAGLYIHARDGTITKVRIPRDCLAFQTGEALELITRGKFRAVPHFVRGVSADATAANATAINGATTDSAAATTTNTAATQAKTDKKRTRIARNTLAVFTQPNLWEMVDERRDFAAFAREIVAANH